jgi:hypothetical protein
LLHPDAVVECPECALVDDSESVGLRKSLEDDAPYASAYVLYPASLYPYPDDGRAASSRILDLADSYCFAEGAAEGFGCVLIRTLMLGVCMRNLSYCVFFWRSLRIS